MAVREITEMIIWLGFFCSVFFAFLYFLRFRNTERMSLIDKGVDVSEIFKKRYRPFPWFMIGFFILGLGFGLLVSSITYFIIDDRIPKLDGRILPLLVLGTLLLFGALGIILGHHLEQKKKI